MYRSLTLILLLIAFWRRNVSANGAWADLRKIEAQATAVEEVMLKYQADINQIWLEFTEEWNAKEHSTGVKEDEEGQLKLDLEGIRDMVETAEGLNVVLTKQMESLKVLQEAVHGIRMSWDGVE